MNKRQITVEKESWPLENVFRISRGARTATEVIKLSIKDGNYMGWAEAVPYARYGETLDSVVEQINSIREQLENGLDNDGLNKLLPAGAARNAVDCALWDLEAKNQHRPIHEILGLTAFDSVLTAQTIGIDTIEEMAKSAALLSEYPLLKVKLDQHSVIERMKAVSEAAPESQFIIDANEAWEFSALKDYAEQLLMMRVVLIEQPLAAANDELLRSYNSPIPLCADESVHTLADLDKVAERYQAINIKLDKTGGLTEAIKLFNGARKKKLSIMTGCMVGTSLAMAPATLLASQADFVDLDAPELLAKDRPNGFIYNRGQMSEPENPLWGGLN